MTLADLAPGDTFRFPDDPHVWEVAAGHERGRVTVVRLWGGALKRITNPVARFTTVIRVGRGSTLCKSLRTDL